MKEVYKESLLHVWYFVGVVDERFFEFVSFVNIIIVTQEVALRLLKEFIWQMTVPFQSCFGTWCASYNSSYSNVTYCYRLAYDFSYLIFLWSLCQWALAQMVPPSDIIKRVEDEVVGSRPTNCVYNLPLNKMFLMALFEVGWNWVSLST